MTTKQLIEQLAEALEFYVSQAYTLKGVTALEAYDAWKETQNRVKACGCIHIADVLPSDYVEGTHTNGIFIACLEHRRAQHEHSIHPLL